MTDQFLIWRRKSIWLLTLAALAIVLTGHSLAGFQLGCVLCICWTTISLVAFVYGMDTLMDTQPTLKALASRSGIYLIALLSSGLGVALWRGPVTFVSAVSILLLGLLYSHPFPTKDGVFRLKSLTGIKSLWIGIGWGLLIFVGSGSFTNEYAQWAALFVALQVTAGSVLRDLDDLDEDRRTNTRTLPIVFGEKNTYIALHLVNLLSGLVLFIMPLPWALAWIGVIVWRSVNLEWLRLGEPGHYATQYMNLATCGVIFVIRMVVYVVA